MSEKLFKLLKESRINEEAVIEVPEKDIEAPASEVDELSAEEVAEVEEETGKDIPVVEEGVQPNNIELGGKTDEVINPEEINENKNLNDWICPECETHNKGLNDEDEVLNCPACGYTPEKEELDEVRTVGDKVVLKAYDITEVATPEIPDEFKFSMIEFTAKIKEKYEALGLQISDRTTKYSTGNDFYVIPEGETGAGLKVSLSSYYSGRGGYSSGHYYEASINAIVENLASDERFDEIEAEDLINIATKAVRLRENYKKEVEEMADGEQAKIDAYKASNLGKSFWYTEDGHIICKKSKAKVISLESKLNEAPVDILVDKTDSIYNFDELDDEAKAKARDYDKPDSFYNSQKIAINKFLKPENIVSILQSEFPDYNYRTSGGYGGTDLGTVYAKPKDSDENTYEYITIKLEKETNNSMGRATVTPDTKRREVATDAVKMNRLLRNELNAVKNNVKDRFSAEAEKQAKLNNREYYKNGDVYYKDYHDSKINKRLRSDESLTESKTSYYDQFAKVITKMLKDPMTDLNIKKEIKSTFNSALEDCIKDFDEKEKAKIQK